MKSLVQPVGFLSFFYKNTRAAKVMNPSQVYYGVREKQKRVSQNMI